MNTWKLKVVSLLLLAEAVRVSAPAATVHATDGSIQLVLATDTEIKQAIGRFCETQLIGREGESSVRRMETPRRTLIRRVSRKKEERLAKIRRTNLSTLMDQTLTFTEGSTAPHEGHIPNSIDQEDSIWGHSFSSSNFETSNYNLFEESPLLNILPSMKAQLRQWSIKHNITHSALKDLLKVISQTFPDANLPKDPRTLLRTPRSISNKVSYIAGGEFFHFGILGHLTRIVSYGLKDFKLPNILLKKNLPNLLTLKIGIDGVPISRSSKKQFWPILGSLDQGKRSEVFLISLFYGDTKPKVVEEFLNPFVSEMSDIEANGILVNEKQYNVRIRVLVADTPARAYLKCVKGHSGYYSCEKCQRKGKRTTALIFPIRAAAQNRTDSDFNSLLYVGSSKSKSHQMSLSPLCALDVGMVTQVPLDYMHLCCLGIMKRMLMLWYEGRVPHRIGGRNVEIVSERLRSFSKFIPSEFSRKCRGLDDLHFWKATEFRTFILYVGPLALKNVLSKEKYEHFMLFHTAMYIFLSSAADSSEWVDFGEQLLHKFVNDAAMLYYEDILVYNMHSLLHLHMDVRNFGPLDKISAFQFENYMQVIKRRLRTNHSHLAQTVNRFKEEEGYVSHTDPFVATGVGKISSKHGDNCFLTSSGKICVIQSVNNDTNSCSVRYFNQIHPLKNYPCNSSVFGINIVNELSRVSDSSLKSLVRKCILLPHKKRFLCIPLCSSSMSDVN